MYKILISDSLPKEILEKYNQSENVTVDNKSGISAEELIEIIPEYDGLVVRSRTKVTEQILQAATKLKVIGRAGAGVDNIDTKEATHRGIIVMNTPGGNTMAATEQTIAIMLAALRNIPRANMSMLEEKWDRKSYMGNELYQKTIGVIGLGKIGREVAKRLKGFEVNLLAYDPLLSTELAERVGVKLVSLEELLEQSDIITVHAPKIPQTMNLINKDNLKKCKIGVMIVNVARGGIVNEEDLIAALDSGQVSKAAIDVYSSEPPKDYSLAKHPKVVATPHLGASTAEAQTKVADQILEQMIEYFSKNVARNAVNFISVDEEIQPVIKPYFEMAEKLGSIFNQIKKGRLQEVAIRFYGEVLKVPVEPISAYLMVGALKGTETEYINCVNSLAICRDRGISIEIAKKDLALTSHTNIVACDFKTDQGFYHLTGTVFAQDQYHLVECGDFTCDANMEGTMLFVENEDIPGVVGNLGLKLAEYKINIGHLSLGRLKDKKLALNIFNLDHKISDKILKDLATVEGVKEVYAATV